MTFNVVETARKSAATQKSHAHPFDIHFVLVHFLVAFVNPRGKSSVVFPDGADGVVDHLFN